MKPSRCAIRHGQSPYVQLIRNRKESRENGLNFVREEKYIFLLVLKLVEGHTLPHINS